jgi:hypothetical protein
MYVNIVLDLLEQFNHELADHMRVGFDYSTTTTTTTLQNNTLSFKTQFYLWIDRLYLSIKEKRIDEEEFRWTIGDQKNINEIVHIWAKGYALQLSTL